MEEGNTSAAVQRYLDEWPRSKRDGLKCWTLQ
jgi:hypothetical protein